MTRTLSSGSVAYTLNKAGTVTYSVNRARTGEKVEKGTSVFTDCNPGDLMNATSNGSGKALTVTDGENRVANGDSIYFNNSDNTGTMSVKNVTFDVLTGEGIDHVSLEETANGRRTIPTTATTVATCGNGTLKVEKGYEKLITLDKNGINFSFNNAHSR